MSNRLLVLMCVSTAMAGCKAAETHGFVATLGNDTTSVERVVVKGRRVVSDAVGRSPNVVRRHWEAELAEDGSIRKWSLDSHYPNRPDGQRDFHHEFILHGGKLHVVRKGSPPVLDADLPHAYVTVAPWNAFLYGTYELLLKSARGRPDSTHIGQYFFEGWEEGHLGFAKLRNLGGGKFGVRSTGLSGEGVAQLDDAGRLMSYDGEATTYKQDVKRVSDVPDIDALTERFAAAENAGGGPRALSVRDTARSAIGSTKFEIDYSRPLARGRKLVGGLIPFGQVWRTGANAATQFTTTSNIRIAQHQVPAGKYTLWTIPTAQGATLIINRQTGQWGTGYNSSYDFVRIPLRTESIDQPVEAFTIRVAPRDAKTGALIMEWGTFRWSVDLTVG